jgi:hypothetical protein
MSALPPPRAELAGCVWLPRFLAKARQLHDGELGSEYAARFCDRDSVDEHFLRFFGLPQDEMIAAAVRLRADKAFAAWFRSRPGIDAARIAQWNAAAENLGRPGFPMAERLAAVLPTTYRQLDPARVRCIFDLLEADEQSA